MRVQLRKLLAFDAEALIVAKMPVKNIELEKGGGVYVGLDFVNGLHMPCRINHKRTVRISRLILYHQAGNRVFQE